MEVEFYKLASSVKKTGDGALVFYLSNRVLGCKSLSYMNGDTLYPHYDSITGELTLFARSYYDYDDEGNTTAEWLEVWDKKYMYRYKKGVGKGRTVYDVVIGIFGLDGYVQVGEKNRMDSNVYLWHTRGMKRGHAGLTLKAASTDMRCHFLRWPTTTRRLANLYLSCKVRGTAWTFSTTLTEPSRPFLWGPMTRHHIFLLKVHLNPI